MRDRDRWKRRATTLGMWSCVVACLLFGNAARAQVATSADTKAQARQLYDEGLTNYNLGHYTPALAAFEKGYRLWHDSSFLFNIAQCQRALNQYEDAERSYRAYLREAPHLAEAERERIHRLMQEMEKAIQSDRAKQPPTGTQAPGFAGSSSSPPLTTTTIVSTNPRSTERPVYRRRWFWPTVVGGVVVVGVAVGLSLALTLPKNADAPGSIPINLK